MHFLPYLCFVLCVLASTLVHAATLGNPGNNQSYSGIGVISGWKCSANGPLTVRFNGGTPIPLGTAASGPMSSKKVLVIVPMLALWPSGTGRTWAMGNIRLLPTIMG